ncbi:mitochondrial protein [Wolfiporia cocos MD-104 SS10]|uniref:SURF1-like protein n=1 Tax=Wolfiporia cocos (strain MD-104) TaxID=742152 RepID=A0A2H3IW91_WOLCO|nr:mitochondrial protein [Wolfiporia cocos MD-104 SS10]
MFNSLRSAAPRGRALFKRRPTFNVSCARARAESTAAGGSVPQAYKPKRTPWITPIMVLVGTIPIFTFALGTWQVDRLKWKVALIDELEEKLQREPLLLPNRVNLAAIPDFVYRKVIVNGHWDAEHCILLGPRVRDSTSGYHVVVPLVRPGGSTVLINRGFVTKEHADGIQKQLENGEVEVYGMLRTTAKRNFFTPDNQPEKGIWYWGDASGMAEYAGGEQAGVQPVLIDEIFEGHGGEVASRLTRGVPIGKPPVVDVRNAHASYVATWYALSAFTSVMFVRLLLKQRQARMRVPR